MEVSLETPITTLLRNMKICTDKCQMFWLANNRGLLLGRHNTTWTLRHGKPADFSRVVSVAAKQCEMTLTTMMKTAFT